jgi:hypothetical protein
LPCCPDVSGSPVSWRFRSISSAMVTSSCSRALLGAQLVALLVKGVWMKAGDNKPL